MKLPKYLKDIEAIEPLSAGMVIDTRRAIKHRLCNTVLLMLLSSDRICARPPEDNPPQQPWHNTCQADSRECLLIMHARPPGYNEYGPLNKHRVAENGVCTSITLDNGNGVESTVGSSIQGCLSSVSQQRRLSITRVPLAGVVRTEWMPLLVFGHLRVGHVDVILKNNRENEARPIDVYLDDKQQLFA